MPCRHGHQLGSQSGSRWRSLAGELVVPWVAVAAVEFNETCTCFPCRRALVQLPTGVASQLAATRSLALYPVPYSLLCAVLQAASGSSTIQQINRRAAHRRDGGCSHCTCRARRQSAEGHRVQGLCSSGADALGRGAAAAPPSDDIVCKCAADGRQPRGGSIRLLTHRWCLTCGTVAGNRHILCKSPLTSCMKSLVQCCPLHAQSILV